jgi:hypothetical protein
LAGDSVQLGMRMGPFNGSNNIYHNFNHYKECRSKCGKRSFLKHIILKPSKIDGTNTGRE